MLKNISKSLFIIFALLVFGGYETYACVVHKQHCWQRWGHHWHSKKKLDLKIDYEGYYNKQVDGQPNAGHWSPRDLRCERFFNFRDIKPGDFGEGTVSLHLKNQDAWACMIVKPKMNDDRRSSEPELQLDEKDNRRNKWDGELAQNLDFRIWADICKKDGAKTGDNVFQPNCDQLLYEGTAPLDDLKISLADWKNGNVFTDNKQPLKKNKEYFIGMDWQFPASVGNEAQTDTYQVDIEFEAVQKNGNEKFECFPAKKKR